MIEIKNILSDRERIEKALRKRLDNVDFTQLIADYNSRKSVREAIGKYRHSRKTLSAQIAKLMGENQDVTKAKADMAQLNQELSGFELQDKAYSMRIDDYLADLPNVPEDEVPSGGKENNEPLEYCNEKPCFSYVPREHVEIASRLQLVDYERGVKIGGRGKWVYWGDGALLEWGLLNYFLECHRKNGYTFVLPPHILRLESGFNAGQFPKFRDSVFFIKSYSDGEDEATHFLLPTAETALANLYVDEVLSEDVMPIRMCAYSPCYRREAGAYRTEERGTIRGNQFNKVELFVIAHPDGSEMCFQKMVRDCMALMDGLGLHYRVSRLAAQDCSEAMAKTYDIEVWLPSIGKYKEVSSVSTAHTFQAVRGNIKFRDTAAKKNRFVHTLNGSGLATSRVFPAILEQYQLEDGRVRVPDVLQSYVGKEYLSAP